MNLEGDQELRRASARGEKIDEKKEFV